MHSPVTCASARPNSFAWNGVHRHTHTHTHITTSQRPQAHTWERQPTELVSPHASHSHAFARFGSGCHVFSTDSGWGKASVVWLRHWPHANELSRRLSAPSRGVERRVGNQIAGVPAIPFPMGRGSTCLLCSSLLVFCGPPRWDDDMFEGGEWGGALRDPGQMMHLRAVLRH